MKPPKYLSIFIVLGLSSATALFAETPKVKISGLIFGDYYYFADNHNDSYRNQNGLWIRRIYLTFNTDLSEQFSARLRFEMKQVDTYSGNANDNMYPFVKDAYLRYKFSNQQVLFGIQPPPNFALVQDWWGYRFVEKTMTDLQKIESSRDLGLAAKGYITSNGNWRYHLMYGNNSSTKSESNKEKKVYGAVQYYPLEKLVIEAFAGYAGLFENDSTISLQGFVGYKNDLLSLGGQYFYQFDDQDYQFNGLSLFGDIKFAEKWKVLARTDFLFDGSPNGDEISYIPFDTTAKSAVFFIIGIDWTVVKNVNITPNLEATIYQDNDSGKNDIVPRITFYWKF
jgi:hypothetical protein